MEECIKESLLDAGLEVQDVDREIAFTLLSLAYPFERHEIDWVVAYAVYHDEQEIGRFVIAPGTGPNPRVRFREHYCLPQWPSTDLETNVSPPGPTDTSEDSLSDRVAILRSFVEQTLDALSEVALQSGAREGAWFKDSPPEPSVQSFPGNGKGRDSSHFAFPRRKRLDIVRHYRTDRINGEVANKDQWARKHYQISGRTLSNYESEFPEPEE